MKNGSFSLSDIGAQSAWKGFTSQTLYILNRLVFEQNNSLEYYPEHLEDLMIKDNNEPIEVVQVKDITHELSLSDLDSTTQSEGLFRRALSLRKDDADKLIIRIVHFGPLGKELKGLSINSDYYVKSITNKFSKKYNFSDSEITWLLDRIKFEKVNTDELIKETYNKLSSFVPIMASPKMAQDLLTYYVFMLSKTKGKTSKREWQEKVLQIGSDMSSFDGYSREYGSSLLRLIDMKEKVSFTKLESEFRQGVSTRPEHIRAGLDLERHVWIEKIKHLFTNSSVVVVKGVSGQGKSALCYRYLLKNYKEEQVFCVRRIANQVQAENLIKAMTGLSKHFAKDLILYIDVNSGEYEWAWLVREAQLRGLKLNILISVREEDFNLTNADRSQIAFSILDVELFKDEAKWVFQTITKEAPHEVYRSFEEAWQTFGSSGPFLEFIFLLNNNQSLRQRLVFQLNKIVSDAKNDSESWLALLRLVCYAGQVGASVLLLDAKKSTSCNNISAALNRMKEEYLIRSTEDGRYLVATHPLRAKVIYDILKDGILYPESDLLIQSLKCTENQYPKLLLMYYFLNHPFEEGLIKKIADINLKNWEAFAGILNSMLWLDVHIYIYDNLTVFKELFKEKGRGRTVFMPIDITGLLRPNEFIGEQLIDIFPNVSEYLEQIKTKFKSTGINYSVTDEWVDKTNLPMSFPENDTEWEALGYSLFWMSQRDRKESLGYSEESIIEAMHIGSIESRVSALKGIFFQGTVELYNQCAAIIQERIIKEYKVIWIDENEESITYGFVPPIFSNDNSLKRDTNFNHFWTMKMVHLLSSTYAEKNIVGSKLVGADLLGDLGVEVIDDMKNIPKENRPDHWITQLNSWYLNVIDYVERPDTWNEYVSRVIKIRYKIVDTLIELIKLIDKLYDKGHIVLTQAPDKMSSLYNELLKVDFLLPKTVVDPYGLHGEGSTLEADYLPPLMNISIKLYENFRRSLNDFTSNLNNFIGQCSEVINARNLRQPIETISNCHLLGFNLYSAAKQCYIMQKEFRKLFLLYAEPSYKDFENQEKQTFELAINIWSKLTNTPVVGNESLSYSARQIIRSTERNMIEGFYKIINSEKWSIKIHDITDTYGTTVRYLLYDFDISKGKPIEWCLKELCIDLRRIWKDAKDYNGYRLYLDTIWPEMVFVPLYMGITLFGAFSMPIYRILDIPEEKIDSLLIPAEIPQELVGRDLSENEIYTQWRQAFPELLKLRMLLIQYQQILDTVNNESLSIVESGLKEWSSEWSNEVTKTLSSFIKMSSKGFEKFACFNNEEVSDLFNLVVEKLTDLGDRIELLDQSQDIDKVLECIGDISSGMIFLSPYIIRID